MFDGDTRDVGAALNVRRAGDGCPTAERLTRGGDALTIGHPVTRHFAIFDFDIRPPARAAHRRGQRRKRYRQSRVRGGTVRRCV
ncbi:hypothetical protein [Burkholderia diffusa]|uniref:hypothetical protein n=1 Tax=Burkholderia diffusa TaxID=488732 RepID=UPI00157B1972|nr:hypothetical protein [Burkholderia diffusa]NTY36812.1 hypothetical protein [Burkholderia diffusa]